MNVMKDKETIICIVIKSYALVQDTQFFL